MKIKNHHFSGFSLVEIAVALGIAGFCLSSIIGLLPIGIRSNQSSIEQTTAASIAKAIVADLRAKGPNSQKSPTYNLVLPLAGTTTNGAFQTIYLSDTSFSHSLVTSGAFPSRYRVSVGALPPAGGQRTATPVRVLVTWPAMADRDPAAWPTNYSGSYETFTILDCN
jgi:Tfp pilus assembly protein PilV